MNALVLEGLNDYSDQLEDAVLPVLIVAIASQEPAWMREAARFRAIDDNYDWAYEDWKMERENARLAQEFADDMARMDNDGAPIHRDHIAWSWGLE
jgi:hypothetical protein